MKEGQLPNKYRKSVRDLIIKRDQGVSQLRTYSEERGWHRTGGYCDVPDECRNLQVHHIISQRRGGSNHPSNMITLAECQHNGRCKDKLIPPGDYRTDRNPNGTMPAPGKWTGLNRFVVHRDMQQALMTYTPTNNTLIEVFATRDQKIIDGEIYHNDLHDTEMLETAKLRSKMVKLFK